MIQNEIIGRHYKTGKRIAVKWVNSKITEVREIIPPNKDIDNIWIAPPLFDLQINGFAGVDFQNLNVDKNALLKAVFKLQQCCCSKFFLTLITDDWEKITEKLKRLKSIRDSDKILKNAIAGWHIEGPFLSEKSGFCGAHNPDFMIDPRPEHIYQLREILENDRILLTIAPERQGALEVIKLASKLDFTVFLGHSDANTETIKSAIEAGAVGFTHLGNGCPQYLDRKDNILWRILDIDDLKISLIPDSIHISPPLFRIIHKVKNRADIFYISDAVSGAAAPPGNYQLGDIKITVEKDGTIWNRAKTGYAGSSLRPFDGILRSMKMLGCQWQKVWENYSEIPAATADINCDIQEGNSADFVVIKGETNGLPEPVKIVVSGETVWLDNQSNVI